MPHPKRISPVTMALCACSIAGPLGACDESGKEAPDTTPDAALDDGADDAADTAPQEELPGVPIPREEQLPGDPEAGLRTLASAEYVGCGVPAELYPVAERVGIFGDEPGLPGRDSPLPYYMSQFTTAGGIEVVGPNCFSCHAGVVAGEVILGAPGIDIDYSGFADQIGGMQAQAALLENVLEPDSYAELLRFISRFAAIAPYVQTEVVGVNPADNVAAALFAHRDPETLAWSDEPLIDPPDEFVVPIDVPPLWRMKKKNAMLYTAAGRGDHARIMMTTSTLCVDSVEEAQKVYDSFDDVRAWIASLTAPAWPEAELGPIDRALAAEGEAVFVAECSKCHGTYGANDGEDTYPNLWVPVADVATDPLMVTGGTHAASRFVEWFNASFYGETAWLEPQAGYVPPPLDGIWATAPFLHNGSVPSVAALLDSRLRPRYWRRVEGFDAEQIGLRFEPSQVGHADIHTASKRFVYDTTLPGYSNSGHLYGDVLGDGERRAVIEYLKTL